MRSWNARSRSSHSIAKYFVENSALRRSPMLFVPNDPLAIMQQMHPQPLPARFFCNANPGRFRLNLIVLRNRGLGASVLSHGSRNDRSQIMDSTASRDQLARPTILPSPLLVNLPATRSWKLKERPRRLLAKSKTPSAELKMLSRQEAERR